MSLPNCPKCVVQHILEDGVLLCPECAYEWNETRSVKLKKAPVAIDANGK